MVSPPKNNNTDNNQIKCGVIPAGTRIKLYEAPLTLQHDVKVDASQEFINKVLKDQEDFYNGINCCSQQPKDAS
ncbi:hypothetical protein BEN74_04820 [Acinetobacter sp. WCHAc010034]|nr:hypothetical protein BEN74_04820 [Acinetobacter sp. WCHAc010034]